MKKTILVYLFLSVSVISCQVKKNNLLMPLTQYSFAYEASFVTEEANDNRWVNFRKPLSGGIIFNTSKDSIILISYLNDVNNPYYGLKRVGKDVDNQLKNIPNHYIDYELLGLYKQLIQPVQDYYVALYYSPKSKSLLQVSYHGSIVNCVFMYTNTANFTNPFKNPKSYFNMLKENFPPEKPEVDSAYSSVVSH